MNARSLLATLFVLLALGSVLRAGEDQAGTIDPLVRVVDLNVGQEATVELCDGTQATVKLLDLDEKRDSLRNAVRKARVTVDVNGEQITLTAATYHLPVTVGRVQIDCAITKGHLENGDHWALDADARLRLWPAGSPWIRPETFTYPVNQKWFASYTLMANEIGDDERPADKSIYYHWGLDTGGADQMVDVLAATDGRVVSAGNDGWESAKPPPPVRPRYDVVYLRDGRGWYYRYSHLDSIDGAVRPGAEVRQGQKIGVLGKEGASGGWSHLHFDVVAPQPSGRYGIREGYAFLWQAYRQKYDPKLQAVARPHQLVWTDEPVVLDGTRSWSLKGPDHIKSYRWTFSDDSTADGPTVERVYDRPGTYSEILKITDGDGRIDYDFALVQVVDREFPDRQAPRVHAAYWPTLGIKVGDEITFKVRSFRVDPDEGHERWDFGDGSPTVEVQSDGNANPRAKDGYAVTTHRYEHPGHYLVSVQRTNHRGETGADHLHVLVGPR
jgi:murein DD-endopeptidase MepM/ murein hydrolase activator NlpD